MTFKLKMKRINRGVYLGAVIVIILCIYLIAQKIKFNASKDDIAQRVEDYFSDYLKAMESDIDGIWTDEDKEDKKNDIYEVIDKYWTIEDIANSAYYYYDNKNSTKAKVSEIYNEEFYAGNVMDTSCKFSDDIKVSRYASKGAIVTGTLEVRMSAPEFSSFPLFGDLTVWYDGELAQNEFNAAMEKGKILSRQVEIEVTMDVTVVLWYEDGEWMISNSSIWTLGCETKQNGEQDYVEIPYTDNEDFQTSENGTQLGGE